MYSGPWEKTTISAALGVVIGAIDAVGFLYTAKLFFSTTTVLQKSIAGILEIFRLIALITLIIFLYSFEFFNCLPLIFMAFLCSLGGKMVLIFKGLKQKVN
jgi:hypothetical protein